MYALTLFLLLQSFTYPVVREKTFKDEPGRLEISEAGVSYKSDNGKTAIQLPFRDIREADVSDPTVIKLESYDVLKRALGGRRTYEFHLRGVNHDEALVRFLEAQIPRPILGAYSASSKADFQVPAYHKHAVGGCHGSLEFRPEGIRFVSDKEDHSRTWLYTEMETIGSADPFSFRVTTFAETFNFELKDRLPAEAYQMAWRKVYGL